VSGIAALFADVAAARRLSRAKAIATRRAAGPGRGRLPTLATRGARLLGAGLPWLGVLNAPGIGDPNLFGMVVCTAYFGAVARSHLRLLPDDVLRSPSRRAAALATWTSQAPTLLVGGLGAAVSAWIITAGIDDLAVRIAVCLAAASTYPLLASVIAWAMSRAAVAGRCREHALLLGAAGSACLLLGSAVSALLSRGADARILPFALALGGSIIGVPIGIAWAFHRRGLQCDGHVASVAGYAAAMLAIGCGLVGVGLCGDVDNNPRTAAFVTGLLAVVPLAGAAYFVAWLRSVEDEDVGLVEARGTAPATRRGDAVDPLERAIGFAALTSVSRAGSVPPRAGDGSLRRAAWILHRQRWRRLRLPWITGPFLALGEVSAPILGAVAALCLLSALSVSGLREWRVLALLLALLFWLGYSALSGVRSPLHLAPRPVLWILGTEPRTLAVHNARFGLLLAVIPAAVGAALVNPWSWRPGAESAAAIALVAAFLLLRHASRSGRAAETAGLHPRLLVAAAAVAVTVAAGWSLALIVVSAAALFYGGDCAREALRGSPAATRDVERAMREA
jgi:hypothetical protein